MPLNWKRWAAGAVLAMGLQGSFAQSLIIDTAGVDAALKRGAIDWDVRDADDYAAGHIAGAVNFGDAGDLFRDAHREDPPSAAVAAKQVNIKDGMSLKPPEQLKGMYAKLDPAKETVVYCQSGVRASATAIMLRDLGFSNVKVYEASWLRYAGVLSAPAENEVFVNVGALNGRIGSLQNRVRSLETELGKLQQAGKR